ncbi:FecR family protein [Chitinophaga lutea]|nr:FecR domain-containing protein [Chitinophaga lutea]
MNQQLLDKYFKGLCSEDEVQQVEAWLEQSGEDGLDGFLKASWRQANPAPVTKVRRLHWLRPAAAAMLAGCVALAGWWLQGRKTATTGIARHMDTIANPGPGVKLVSMPDGSKVWLNAQACIIFDDTYNTTSRRLRLTGEAYIEVAASDRAPFSVNAGGLITTALGTSFNIASPAAEEKTVQVSLISGKVAISAADSASSFERVVLLPGDRLTYTDDRHFKQSTFLVREAVDWKDGKVIFENTRLDDAFAKLQRRYGRRFVMMDKTLAGKRLTASFPAQVTVDLILQKLAFVQELRFDRHGDTTYVYKEKRK